MTTISVHKKIVKEFLDDINEKIKADLLLERQKIIAFSASEATTNLFAILLHKKNFVEPSFHINHRYFASEKIAERKFNFDIPKKEKLIPLLVKQEGYRDKLCYGKEKEVKIVNSAIKNLFEIKNLIDSILKEEK